MRQSTSPIARLARSVAALAIAVACAFPTSASAQLCGDVNDSGMVTTGDALSVLRYSVGQDVNLVKHGGQKFWYWPHNLYLYIANNAGFVGLGIFLMLLASFWKISKSRVTDLRDPDYVEAYLFVVRAQLVFFMVDQFKIEYWRNPTYQFQVWLMFAFWVAAARLAETQRKALAPIPAHA